MSGCAADWTPHRLSGHDPCKAGGPIFKTNCCSNGGVLGRAATCDVSCTSGIAKDNSVRPYRVLVACRDTVQDFSDILGALYLSVLFLGIINAMSVQSVVFFQRSVLYREYAAGEGCLCTACPRRDTACYLSCTVYSPAYCGLPSYRDRDEMRLMTDCQVFNLGLSLAPV